MGCPHPDLDCEDCAEAVSCAWTPPPKTVLPLPKSECDGCPLARLVSDFIHNVESEEAWLSGDAERDEWKALHPAHVQLCPLDLEKGAGQ